MNKCEECQQKILEYFAESLSAALKPVKTERTERGISYTYEFDFPFPDITEESGEPAMETLPSECAECKGAAAYPWPFSVPPVEVDIVPFDRERCIILPIDPEE